MYHGKKCRSCRDNARRALSEKAKLEHLEQKHKAGFILVHSCISDPHNKSEHKCRCRHWVSREIAAEMCRAGEIVDYETRAEFFFGQGRDVLTTRKKLRAPRTRTITRPEIETSIADFERRKELILSQASPELRQEVEKMLKAPHPLTNRIPTISRLHIEEAWHSKSEKAQEERDRIEAYGQLTLEAWQCLIREVPADEFDRIEESQRGVPVIQGSPIGADDRTAGSVGVDVVHARLDDPEELMTGSEEDEDASTDIAEAAETADPESAEDLDTPEDSSAEQAVLDKLDLCIHRGIQ
jgi:hypothetical protein